MKDFLKAISFVALFFSIPCIVGAIACCFRSEMDSSNFWAWGLIVTYPVLIGLTWSKIRNLFKEE